MHFRVSVQKHAAKLHIDLHGVEGVIFARPSCSHLKAFVPLRIYLAHIFYHSLSQLFEAFIFHINHGTDAGNAKYFFQALHRFVKVKFRQCIHINAAVRPAHLDLALRLFQRIFDLFDQSLLKQITILALDANLRILN